MNKEEYEKSKRAYDKKINDLRDYQTTVSETVLDGIKNGISDHGYQAFMKKMVDINGEIENLLSISNKPEEIVKWNKEQEMEQAKLRLHYEEVKNRYDADSVMGKLKRTLASTFKKDSSEEIVEGRSK